MQTYQWGIFALALGAFGLGTTEFFPMGLLPTIADGVQVSIPAAGLLISAYAVGVMFGAPLVTLYMTRFSHKASLIALMAVFFAGNLLSAIAVDYTTLLISRVVTSMSHGAFFGIGALVAMKLAPVGKQGSAVASMFLGLTIANIIGVPIATWLGQSIHWRTAFAATSALGLVAMIGLLRTLPHMEKPKRPNVKSELQAILQPAALRTFLTTVLCAGSMFTLYTYITPILQTLANVVDANIAYLLMTAGIGFTIGNYVSGKLADKSPDLSLTVSLVGQVIILAAFSFVTVNLMTAAITIFLWGVVNFMIGPPLQMKVMTIADKAPGLASSINIGAFNLGNALGAALGGAVITIGLGYEWIPASAAILSLAALILLAINRKLVAKSQ
ncbi:MFS transporter [Marinomonas fungiae]|uniref:Predicted arabinose efflux permease, MFS family n=1 Tax=Marinomonas fungiae TaxID=1137284 RepID=A0A0K6IHS3_9GAMM|nr:MFS transporter [Marinomonas fungiae]CUB02655.1 Predicted arabinose efflux permease, MFS family [Marinomonas fungiae]